MPLRSWEDFFCSRRNRPGVGFDLLWQSKSVREPVVRMDCFSLPEFVSLQDCISPPDFVLLSDVACSVDIERRPDG